MYSFVLGLLLKGKIVFREKLPRIKMTKNGENKGSARLLNSLIKRDN